MSLRAYPRWPLTLVLPLGVAIGMFFVAVGTTQVGLHILQERETRAIEAKATIFLDALAGILAPRLDQGPDPLAPLLADPLAYGEIVVAQALVARFEDAQGEVRVLVGGREGAERQRAAIEAALDRIAGAPPGRSSFSIGSGRAQVVLARAYAVEGRPLYLAAALDTSAIVAGTRRDEGWAFVIDILLGAAAALLTFGLTRRAIAPLDALARDLAAQGRAGRLLARRGLGSGGVSEIGRLKRAIEARLEEEEARTRAVADLGEKERDALLAKLAAGLAHEVRNPLAGLLNAVSTLRRFGDKPAVRTETLDLIERGLRSIERVADAMLSTYRPAPGRMRFTREDLADIQVLVAPEARRRHVALDWDVEAMRPIAADADALRQTLLNLLLNACKASGENGRVGLRVAQSEGETAFEVVDSGPGMPEDVLAFVVDGTKAAPIARAKGLGLWMVGRLLDDLGGQMKVESRSGEGTRVTVRLPVGPAPADAQAA